MARSLLAPTAFVTLLGLAPGCFRATASPVVAAMSGTMATPDAEAADAPGAPAHSGLVAYATTRSGNARAPSYDDAMIEMKGPDPVVGVDAAGLLTDAPPAVLLALETTLDLPPALTP